MAPSTASLYRQPLWDPHDALFLRCLAVTTFLAIVLVTLDLDRPQSGRIRVNLETLLDLKRTMERGSL